jgi:hypothetical protein
MRITPALTFAQVRKAAVNIAALGAEVVAANVLHGRALAVVTAVVAVAGAVTHYLTPNALPTQAEIATNVVSGYGPRIESIEAELRRLTATQAPAAAIDPHDIPTPPPAATPGQAGSLA